MELLKLAYEVFENDMAIINIITDNDFVSVTEFSQVISTIIGKKVKPKFINIILVAKCIINRNDFQLLEERQSLNPNINKYIVNPNFSNYCEERAYGNGIFYVWKADFLFGLLGIDFKNKINDNNVATFCESIKNNVRKNVDFNQVYKNLLYLQFIFKRECIFFR